MKIAIVGIQGLPNQYGGFETLSEFLVKYLGHNHEFTVYCSSTDQKEKPKNYLGAKLKYYNITSHGAKGIIFDCKCLIDAAKRNNDIILILGFGPGLIIPFLSKKTKKKIILNFGGLDWERNKWSKIAQIVIKICEKLLVKNSANIISDNKKIKDYIYKKYKRDSTLIAYGGDQAKHLPITDELKEKYPFLNNKYAFAVARIQSDNNIEMLMQAFIKLQNLPFVLVGNWSSTKWGRSIKALYKTKSPLILLDAIYDKNILDVLRSNCYLYVHGHSAGGTNPSLCEAMFLGLPIIAFSNGYNENTTFFQAKYFNNADDLCTKIETLNKEELNNIRPIMKELAKKHYCWKQIADDYEKLFIKTIL